MNTTTQQKLDAASKGKILTRCCACKFIRNHESKWIPVERWAIDVATYTFEIYAMSDTFCPDCMDEKYGRNSIKMGKIVNDERAREQSGYYTNSLAPEIVSILKLLTALSKFQ